MDEKQSTLFTYSSEPIHHIHVCGHNFDHMALNGHATEDTKSHVHAQRDVFTGI